MSEISPIYEITQMMLDTNHVKQDMNEALSMVQKMFRDKYFNKLQGAISATQMRINESPSKEIQLIQSLKPFLHPSIHENIDKLVDSYMTMNLFRNIQGELRQPPNGYQNIYTNSAKSPNSIHEDGIYDIDSRCQATRNNSNMDMTSMMLMLTLMNKK